MPQSNGSTLHVVPRKVLRVEAGTRPRPVIRVSASALALVLALVPAATAFPALLDG